MPTGTQAVLSVLDEAHALEQPSFGAGFDLTTSYGQDMQSRLEEIEVETMRHSRSEFFERDNSNGCQGLSRRWL